jgi:hypothetical protein
VDGAVPRRGLTREAPASECRDVELRHDRACSIAFGDALRRQTIV